MQIRRMKFPLTMFSRCAYDLKGPLCRSFLRVGGPRNQCRYLGVQPSSCGVHASALRKPEASAGPQPLRSGSVSATGFGRQPGGLFRFPHWPRSSKPLSRYTEMPLSSYLASEPLDGASGTRCNPLVDRHLARRARE